MHKTYGDGKMNEDDMRALITLRRTRNITHAAAELSVTQPTLTRRIQQLEEVFGAPLLDRNNKGVVFTAQGEFLAGRAGRMLDFLEETASAVKKVSGSADKPVRIAAANSYAEYSLPAVLKNYSAAAPGSRFEVHSAMSGEVLRMVKDGRADIGVIRGDFAFGGFRRLLSRDRCSVISKTQLDLAALPITPHIEYPLGRPNLAVVEKWWYGRFREPPMTMYHVSGLSICKQLVAKGLGFAFTLVEALDPLCELFHTPLTNADGSYITRDTTLIQSEESMDDKAACAFRDYLLEEAGAGS